MVRNWSNNYENDNYREDDYSEKKKAVGVKQRVSILHAWGYIMLALTGRTMSGSL